MTTACPGCGALLEEREGPTHRYMESSPACWAIYGEVLAREYSNPELLEIHRLTVDAYAVQHPGHDNPSAVNSVAVHLIRLYLLLDRGMDTRFANDAMTAIAGDKRSFHRLAPPSSSGSITVVDLWKAQTAGEHRRIARAWAMSVWRAWSPHHAIIRQWSQSNPRLKYPGKAGR
jgi:hypothetical protein